MKRLKIFLASYFVFITHIYGQNDESTAICKATDQTFCMEIKAIEALLIRCDTLYPQDKYMNKYLFFDNENRLRKYRTHYSFNDGSSEYLDFLVYYNPEGELIYLDYQEGCNCDDEYGYFVLRNGKIIERNIHYDCGCCEDNDTASVIIMPDIGTPMPRSISWWDCSSFFDAATLLSVLRVYEYEYLFNAEFSGKENVFATILDRMELKKDTLFFDEKGWNRTIKFYDETNHIRKCDISNSSETGSEYIRLYYDINGSLFLTECIYRETIPNNNTHKEQFGLCIENGIITEIKYYYNPEFEQLSETDYQNKSNQIFQSLINTRLDKTPYFKKDLSGFFNTNELKKTLSSYN